VAIGISTGGPQILEKVLGGLPVDLAVPVVVAQHMPSGFSELLAKRLDGTSAIKVKEVEDGEKLSRATVYIAKTGQQICISCHNDTFKAQIFEDHGELYKPSVDILFKSLAQTPVVPTILGIIMTGMGNDGLQGARELKAKGAHIIAESEKTCTVYGMPKAVIEAGLADKVEEAPDMAAVIMHLVGHQA